MPPLESFLTPLNADISKGLCPSKMYYSSLIALLVSFHALLATSIPLPGWAKGWQNDIALHPIGAPTLNLTNIAIEDGESGFFPEHEVDTPRPSGYRPVAMKVSSRDQSRG